MSEPTQPDQSPPSRRRLVRLAVQTAVSVALVAVLIYLARQGNVLGSLGSIPPVLLAAAAALQLAACVLNSRRWQLLLRWLDVDQRLRDLTSLYFIGQFFSLFLPTGVGGDGVRIYQVARRSGKTPEAILATLQERLLGVGITGLIGLVAMLLFLTVLPAEVRLVGILMQLAALSGVVLVLQPALILRGVSRLGAFLKRNDWVRRLSEKPVAARLGKAIRPIRDLPPLTPGRLGHISLLTMVGILLGIGAQAALAQGLQIETGFLAFCLVVPMIWIIRLLPVSLNGLGISEGALVFLLGLFGVPTDKAFALGLAVLGLQTSFALAGGLLLAVQIVQGGWKKPQPATDSPSSSKGDTKNAA
jgi:glycosyltransferase 2 family protein